VNDAGLLAALGIVSACVAGLIWVIKRMFNDILPALNHLTKATVQNTEATKSADTYLKQRNGRDIEKHAELLLATQAIPTTLQQIADEQAKAIISAMEVREQHVAFQTVNQSMVKDETVQHETIEDKK
jgi:CHASE2 domain-containing sensor protein